MFVIAIQCNKASFSLLCAQASSLPMLLRVHSFIPKTIEVQGMKPSNLVKDLKAEICRQEGIQTWQQILKVSGKELEDGKSLNEYNIRNGSKLYLETSKITVRYRGKDIEIFNPAVKTVAQVKEELFQREGYPVEQQMINFAGKKLLDYLTLIDYNIGHGSTMHLDLKIPK